MLSCPAGCLGKGFEYVCQGSEGDLSGQGGIWQRSATPISQRGSGHEGADAARIRLAAGPGCPRALPSAPAEAERGRAQRGRARRALAPPSRCLGQGGEGNPALRASPPTVEQIILFFKGRVGLRFFAEEIQASTNVNICSGI